MPTYRIVRWHPDQPNVRQLASGQTFTEFESAERIKSKMEKYLSTFAFAVELEPEPLPNHAGNPPLNRPPPP